MHHILNVEQIFVENIFIECNNYSLKSLRRAGSLVAEPKGTFHKNRFCVSLLQRSIQDLSDHDAPKEPKNLLWKWNRQFL